MNEEPRAWRGYCPRCNQSETNESFTFCTEDGTQLIWNNEFEGEATLVANFPPMARYAETLRTGHASAATTLRFDGIKRRRFGAALAITLSLILAGWAYTYFRERDNGAIGSLAVLPFLNVDADQSLEYLSDGMTETLISDLSELPNLNVKARSSVFRYKGVDTSVRAVGVD